MLKDRSIYENDNHFAREIIECFGVAIRKNLKLVLEASCRQQSEQCIMNGTVKPQISKEWRATAVMKSAEIAEVKEFKSKDHAGGMFKLRL